MATSTTTSDEKSLPAALAGYAEPPERPPLVSYLVTMLSFSGLLAAALLAAKKQGRELPERVGAGDV
ncbi:MAG TPA: hypothetical protein VNB59_06375, partial [Solirubrobacterales bacterium]|nr:hypothetical protein [Solirubrobacterales bacterium]